MQNNPIKPVYFYTFYFALIGVIIFLWFFFPAVGLIVLLVLSAYHFGQSQFCRYTYLPNPIKIFIYLFWGSSILAGLIVYNTTEIVHLFNSSQDTQELLSVFQSSIHRYILGISTISFLVLFFYTSKAISRKQFLMEIGLFTLIHVSFYFQSLLIGFSIYFATLHSLEVLLEEYSFLKKQLPPFNLGSFLSILIPYTLVSLLGLIILLGLSHFGVLPISKTLVVFISISALTLPHSIVMESFYSSFYTKLNKTN
jgi:Brp/Blh family beta-carotene 15,15'-monooxygenase